MSSRSSEEDVPQQDSPVEVSNTNQSSHLNISSSLVVNKPPVGVQRMDYLCMFCYSYRGPNIRHHQCPNLRGFELADVKQKKNEMCNTFRSHHSDMSKFLFYDPTELPSQESYSKYEVMQLLENFGHAIVPSEFKDSYKPLKCVPKWEGVVSPSINQLIKENQGKTTSEGKCTGSKQDGTNSVEKSKSVSDQSLETNSIGTAGVNEEQVKLDPGTCTALANLINDLVKGKSQLVSVPVQGSSDCGKQMLVTPNPQKHHRSIGENSNREVNLPSTSSVLGKSSDNRFSALNDKSSLQQIDDSVQLIEGMQNTPNTIRNPPIMVVRKEGKGKGKGKRSRPLSDCSDEAIQEKVRRKSDRPHKQLQSINIDDVVEEFDNSDHDPDFSFNTSKSSSTGNVTMSTPIQHESGKDSTPLLKSSRQPVSGSKSLKSSLKETGAYDIPKEYLELDVFQKFKKFYLQSMKSGVQTATQNIGNLARVMWKLNNCSNEALDFNTHNITAEKVSDYLEDMKTQNFRSQTIKNYCQSIRKFLDFLTSAYWSLHSSDPDEHRRLQIVSDGIKTVQKGWSKVADLDYRVDKINKFDEVEPTLYEVSEIVRSGEPKARQIIDKLKIGGSSTGYVDENDLWFLNTYLSATVCMGQGHRPGVMENMLLKEFCQARQETSEGKTHWVVTVAHHKTSRKFSANIVLDEPMMELFKGYVEVRAIHLQKTNKVNVDTFLVNKKGEPFTKVSNNISRLYERLKIPKERRYTTNHARKAFEEIVRNAPDKVKDQMAKNLAHSSDVADQKYRKLGYKTSSVVSMYQLQREMLSFSQKNPGIVPESDNITFTNFGVPSSQTVSIASEVPQPSATESVDGRSSPVACSSGTAISPCSSGKTHSSRGSNLISKLKGKLVSKSKTPSKSKSSPIMTPRSKACSIEIEYLHDLSPITQDTNLPSAEEIVKAKHVSMDVAQRVINKLRYKKRIITAQIVADKVLMQEARRQGLQIFELTKVPTVPSLEKITRLSNDKFSDVKTVSQQLTVRFKFWQNSLIKQNFDAKDSSLVETHIKSQQWPNLQIVNSAAGCGKGVIVKELPFYKDSIVCDYHGSLISAKEGNEIIKTYKPCSPEEGNYMLFFKYQDKNLCINANEPCKCHPHIQTFGRLINHSKLKPNLKAKVKVYDGTYHVVLVATEDIPPLSELFFDYGTRKGEDGKEIDFLVNS